MTVDARYLSSKPTFGSLLEILQEHLNKHPELHDAALLGEHGDHYDRINACDLVVLTTEDESDWGVAIVFRTQKSDVIDEVFGRKMH